MSRNSALALDPPATRPAAPDAAAPPDAAPAAGTGAPSIVLVGLPGAGKSSVGRRLAARLGLPFADADTEIEAAAGLPVTEIFARYGEAHFRDGERRVIARLLAGPPLVLATGGGAFADARTRAAVRAAGAVSVWLRCPLPVLARRVGGRDTRPMFRGADPMAVLAALEAARNPFYAESDLTVDCTEESPETTTRRVAEAVAAGASPPAPAPPPPTVLPVPLPADPRPRAYEVVVGEGLLARAGALLAPHLPARRVAVVTDATVAALHLPALRAGLEAAGFAVAAVATVPPGETSKSLPALAEVLETLLAAGLERGTGLVALGGGVVGDLGGFAAAVALRGLPFVQVPTTLLAQVDSAVGGKTGVNLAAGKNLAGAFHQPALVLADAATLATLPARELRAGWAEVAKHGLLEGPLWDWCEAAGPAAVAGDRVALARAVLESCRLKAAVVAADEFETAPEGGRALLNLGHTFAHAIEAEAGYGALLHGEAVAIGLHLAAALSARLGHAEAALPGRVAAHLRAVGLPDRVPPALAAPALLARMAGDKKARDGRPRFVLLCGPGHAFTTAEAPPAAVLAVLREAGAGG